MNICFFKKNVCLNGDDTMLWGNFRIYKLLSDDIERYEARST